MEWVCVLIKVGVSLLLKWVCHCCWSGCVLVVEAGVSLLSNNPQSAPLPPYCTQQDVAPYGIPSVSRKRKTWTPEELAERKKKVLLVEKTAVECVVLQVL